MKRKNVFSILKKNSETNLKFGDAMEKIKLYNEKLVFDEIKDKNKEFIEKYIEINNKILEYCYYFMPRMRENFLKLLIILMN